MANTIITKNSITASAVPTSGDLVQGELAVNVTDKRLFTENNGGVVVEVGTNPSSITTGNLTASGIVTIPDNAISGDKVEGGTINAVTINTLTSGTVDINGGAVDGTSVGASTPSTGAFTTLSASGATTLSGGTANGVTYLNGSKVLTSGSALTFDGTNLGVGTSLPAAKLHSDVSGASSLCALNLTNSGSGFGAGVGPSINFGLGSAVLGAFGKIEVLNQTATTGSNSYMAFSTRGGDVLAEKMRIDSAGNVGIGTSSPFAKMNPAGATSTSSTAYSSSAPPTAGQLDVRSTDAYTTQLGGKITFSGISGTGEVALSVYGAIQGYKENAFASNAGGGLILSTTDNASGTLNERARIDSSGNFQLGLTGGAGRLNVSYTYPTTGANWFSNTALPHYAITFNNSNGLVGNISTSGSSTSYNTSSDYRLKEDWQPMTGATERVKALKPVNFAWKVDGSRVDGFLAHEAQEVVPECVTGTKDAMRTEEYEVTPAVLDNDGNIATEAVMGEREVPNYQGIDQSKLVPLLTAALQEALTKIDALTARITALEGN
jgi:hypothetical protein